MNCFITLKEINKSRVNFLIIPELLLILGYTLQAHLLLFLSLILTVFLKSTECNIEIKETSESE